MPYIFNQIIEMNRKLIKQLADGEIAVENNGTLDQLKAVLKEAFPEDDDFPSVEYSFYFQFSDYPNEWYFGDITSLPTISVKDFFTEAWRPETGDLVLVDGEPMTFIGDTDDPYNPYLCCMPKDYKNANFVVCKVSEIKRIPKLETISTEEAEKMLKKTYHKPFKIKSC